jgi:hypothetical protein
MKGVIFGLFIASSFFLLVTSFGYDLASVHRSIDEKSPIKLFTHKRVSISCASKCQALSAVDKREHLKLLNPKVNDENPSSVACVLLNGRPDTYYDSKENEVSVCVFEDKSFLKTWDLLR